MSFFIWCFSDIFLGLVHVPVFLVVMYTTGRLSGTHHSPRLAEFLGTGVLLTYSVTLIAAHVGQAARAWYNAASAIPENTKVLLTIVMLVSFLVIILAVISFTVVTLGHLTVRRVARLSTDERAVTSLSIVLGGLAIFIAVMCFNLTTTSLG